jgi:hypothetical protein
MRDTRWNFQAQFNKYKKITQINSSNPNKKIQKTKYKKSQKFIREFAGSKQVFPKNKTIFNTLKVKWSQKFELGPEIAKQTRAYKNHFESFFF